MSVFNPLIRNIDGGDLLESFLISAIASVFVIRVFLKLAHYPQISSGDFHIAHLLFGGFFMLLAFIILFGYLNKTAMQLAAVIGGVGFGMFIDELGKFITRDNNYFFQPTVAIIYIIFVLLFLTFRRFDKQTRFTKKEYLMNALEMMENVVLQDLDPEEKKATLKILSKCDQKDPIVIAMRETLQTSELVEIPESFFRSVHIMLRTIYHSFMRNRWFLRGVIVVFFAKSAITLYQAFQLGIGFYYNSLPFFSLSSLSLSSLGEIISSTIAGAYVVFGSMVIYRSRLHAYKLFKKSLLISLFFTQFFVFYREQFSAIIGLGFNIILLLAIQYMIIQEEED